jgi:ribosomal protein S18 acetylase RimI-like enzyme
MAVPDASREIRTFATPFPLPPGLVLRHIAPPGDYRPMNAIANAVREAVGEDFTTSDEQFARFYEHPTGSDPGTDVVVAERSGGIVGYGRASCRQEVDGPCVYEANVFADPRGTGREVFEALLDALEWRIREMAFENPAGPKVFQAFGGDLDPERDRLLVERGYVAVRHGFAMVRPTLDDLPDAPLPEGLEIRDVQPEHLPAIWAAHVEAMGDLWGWVEPDDRAYEEFLTDPVTSDRSLWRVAWDGDEIAGQVRSYIDPAENERRGFRRGHVEHISVRRPWRRRGLARALIAASFPALRDRGMTEATLGVDTDNPSGALRVYEGCGFVAIARDTTYRKPLD